MTTQSGLDRIMQERRERLARPVEQQVKHAREYAYQLVNDARAEVELIRAEKAEILAGVRSELKLARGSLYAARRTLEQVTNESVEQRVKALTAEAERAKTKAEKVLVDAEKKAVSTVAKANLAATKTGERARAKSKQIVDDAKADAAQIKAQATDVLTKAREEADQVTEQAYEAGLALANVNREEMAEWQRIEGRKRLNEATYEMFPPKRALKVAV